MRTIAARASLVAIALLAPAAALAQRGYTIGVTGFTGGSWQPSGVEAGLVRSAGGASGREVGAMLRLGGFVQDQAVLIGGSQGFFVQLLGMYRQPITTLAMVGSDRNPSYVRLIGVIEGGPSGDINPPAPQTRNYHVSIAALLGFSFGDARLVDEGFSVLAGPAQFVGGTSTLHAQVSLRFQAPLVIVKK